MAGYLVRLVQVVVLTALFFPRCAPVWAQDHLLIDLTPIIFDGDVIPGTGATIFFFTGPPVIDQQGNVAFSAYVTGGKQMLMVASPDGSIWPIAIGGDQVPGRNCEYFQFGQVSVNEGRVACVVRLREVQGSSFKDGVFFAAIGESPQVILVEGDSVSRGTVTDIADAMMNSDGVVFFRVDFDQPELNGTYSWSEECGIQFLFPAQAQDRIDGQPFDTANAVPNQHNAVAFNGVFDYALSSCTTYEDIGVYQHDDTGSLIRVARAGDALPESTFFLCNVYPRPKINAHGITTCLADTRSHDPPSTGRSIVRSHNGSFVSLLSVGDPSTFEDLHEIRSYSINDNNQVVLIGSDLYGDALFRAEFDPSSDDPASVTTAVIRKWYPPGVSALYFTFMGLRAHNNNDQVLLRGRINGTNQAGLWFAGSNDITRLIALEGEDHIIGEVDVRSVTALDYYHRSVGDDGLRMLSDLGVAALRIEFADGSEGVFIATAIETCAGDANGDLTVDVRDILTLLASWGPCANCNADFDFNGQVTVFDLLTILNSWGPCEI